MTKFYLPQIDGLRTLAFLSVFLHHLGPCTDSSSYNRFVACGWVGLDLFFVLSGFLITSILMQEKERFQHVSLKKFMARRVLRIWPLYYTAMFSGFVLFPLFGAFGIDLFSPLWMTMFSDYFLSFFLFVGNLSFAWKIGVVSPFFAVLWSIGVEEQFYLVWGWVFSYVKCSLNRLLVFAWLFSIAARISIYALAETYQAYYYCTFSHLDPIVAGCLLGLNYNKIRELSRNVAAGIFLSSAVLYFLLWQSNPLDQNLPSNILVFLYSSISMLLLVIASLTLKNLAAFLGIKPLTYFAKFTYGMYIFHYVGIFFANKLVGSQFSLARLGIALGLTYVMGVLSWHLIEKRFISLKRVSFSPLQTGEI